MPVEVRGNGHSFSVDTPADLDNILTDLTATASAATLIELRTNNSALTIGIGHPNASVALFLDSDHQSFSSRGEPMELQPDELTFKNEGQTFVFYPHTAVTPAQARAAAVEFLATGGGFPTNVTWIREGGSDTR